jgi:transposase-like protein
MQENLHKQIRRRSLVVGILTSADSYLRLVTSYLVEYSEDWLTARSYIRKELVETCRL